MGRSKWVQIGKHRLPKDRGSYDPDSERSVTEWADSSPGPVASHLWTQNLLSYDSAGDLHIDREAVRREISSLADEVVNTREYDRETFSAYAVEATGLSAKRALNATDREYQARARAVLIAARVAGVKVSPVERRTLNPLVQGRFTELVYGKEGQYENGTLNTKLRAARKEGARWRDAAYRIRANEKAEQLRDYRYERQIAASWGN